MTVNRITGFYSGFDTDKMIKDLIKVEQTKVDNVKGLKQLSSWRQDSYRDAYKVLDEFKSKYFDVLNSSTNLRSKTMFTKFTSSITASGSDVTAVSVKGNTKTTNFEHSITKIEQLASRETYKSGDLGLNDITSQDINMSEIPDQVKFSLTLEGKTKTIEFAKTDLVSQDLDGLTTKLNEVIQTNFGSDYSDIVSYVDNHIEFEKTGVDITILNYSGSEDSLSFLRIESGASNQYDSEKTINSSLGITATDLESMSINGKTLKELGVTTSNTIDEMISTINSSSVNVTLTYNVASDKFTLMADDYGTVNSMELSDELKSKFKLDIGEHELAKNAIVTLDGETLIKSTNEFTFDNVTYTLNSTYDDTEPPIDIRLTRNNEEIISTIKEFVTDYNNIVASFSEKLNEKTYRDYKPLTDDEKEALSETEVTLWESKAKSGILRNDSILSKVLSDMRTALYSSVEGSDVTLYDIGIKTTSNYKDNGKLEIDEDKLESALNENFDSVVALFTSESDKEYLDSENASERYNESGLGDRILDIINDATRITRGTSGTRGSLIEKAGLPGDTSTTSNLIAKEIAVYDNKIDDLLDYLADQEDRYYRKFASMESALAEMQNQSSSLLSQLGMNG